MNKIGVCGDNCSFCPRYIATLSGDIGEFEKVKELWVRMGWRDESFPAENLACHGCTPEVKCAYPQLRDCAYGKKVPNCGLCDNYPCELVNAAFKRTSNLESVAGRVCSKEEIDVLNKAFLHKKITLVRIHIRKKALSGWFLAVS
jgi:hypothetical protein